MTRCTNLFHNSTSNSKPRIDSNFAVFRGFTTKTRCRRCFLSLYLTISVYQALWFRRPVTDWKMAFPSLISLFLKWAGEMFAAWIWVFLGFWTLWVWECRPPSTSFTTFYIYYPQMSGIINIPRKMVFCFFFCLGHFNSWRRYGRLAYPVCPVPYRTLHLFGFKSSHALLEVCVSGFGYLEYSHDLLFHPGKRGGEGSCSLINLRL